MSSVFSGPFRFIRDAQNELVESRSDAEQVGHCLGVHLQVDPSVETDDCTSITDQLDEFTTKEKKVERRDERKIFADDLLRADLLAKDKEWQWKLHIVT